MKTKQPFNKYTILRFIIACHQKSKHMPKNHNTEDSYSAKSSSKKPALNPYNPNPNSTPALYSF